MTTSSSSQTKNNRLMRYFKLDARAVNPTDENGQTFDISFSSEEPYERWIDLSEILDHSPGAVDLSRLNDIGVVLFNHNVDAVCGKINRAWIENGRGCAEITFDGDDASQLVRDKVAGGTLKGVSVGYAPDWDSAEDVKADHKSDDGRFDGPCIIFHKWTPLEVSIVSVPADPTVGVGRQLEPAPDIFLPKQPSNRSLLESMIRFNQNSL
jgi:phage head maturation protease